jgi:hypothetical protein
MVQYEHTSIIGCCGIRRHASVHSLLVFQCRTGSK